MKSSFLAWMQRLLLSTSVLLITILVTQTIPCLAQTRDEIESLCDQLEEAVQNQSIEEIRRLFRVGNATTLEQTLASYEELIEGSDSLSFEIQVMSVQEAEEVAHVTWQRRIHAGTGEKEHLDVTWWRISVASTTDGIRILREEPIAHAKAIWTDLAVRLEPESGRMEGTATVRCELLTGSVDALVFSLNRGPKITGLTDSIGAVPAYRRVGTAVVIPIASDLAPGEQVTFHFGFAGKLFNATAEFGYSNVHIGPEGSYASWLSSWYPQLMGESPGSPGAIRISVPAGLTAVSNGRAGPVVDHGEWREFSFHVEQPLSYSFAAADYYHKSTELDGVSVGVYLLQENVEKADLYIERTTEILDYLWHSIYGMYPYTNFWIVEMPGRVAGRTAGSAEQGLAFFPTTRSVPNFSTTLSSRMKWVTAGGEPG